MEQIETIVECESKPKDSLELLTEIYTAKFIEKWLKKYSVFSDKNLQKWLLDMIDNFAVKGNPKNKFNITGYLGGLNNYCKFHSKSPSDLLLEDLDFRNKRLKEYLIQKIMWKAKTKLVLQMGIKPKSNLSFPIAMPRLPFKKNVMITGKMKMKLI